MKIETPEKVYKSFEQLKSELFPLLTQDEDRKSSRWTSTYIGANLADKAINELLNENSRG